MAEVGLLGELAGRAQTIEHRGVGRLLIEECRVEVPERPVGGVVEAEPLVGREDRDRRRKLVERAAMRLHHAHQLGAHFLDLGRIDADAGTAVARRQIERVEDAPLSGGDDANARRIGLAARARKCGLVARRALEQLKAAC